MKGTPLINRHWFNAVEQFSSDNDRRANVIEHFSWRKRSLKNAVKQSSSDSAHHTNTIEKYGRSKAFGYTLYTYIVSTHAI